MAALHSSKTSVFYQAMPAVGADGSNIMKLIPVKMVNGQFHQTQTQTQKFISLYNTSAPGHVAEKAAESPSTCQEFIRNKVSTADISPSQIHPACRDSVNKSPPPQPTTGLLVKVHPTTAPSALSHQVPVTVKSPALPRGQFLKIPPTAKVQRIPASDLPPRIKDQIFTSSPGSSVPTVVYVSPVATVDQGVTEASGCTTPPLKLNTARGLKPQLKLVPKVSERPNSPTRWVIEEVESCSAESLKTFSSPSATSEDLQSAAETGNLHRQTDNALVMHNGRVFFVTNKSSSSFKTSAATQSLVPSSQRSRGPVVAQTGQNLKALCVSAEVINLCDDDDDPLEDSLKQAPPSNSPADSHQDEDNVIFVSYIPPKTETGTTHTDETGSGGSSSKADPVALRAGGHDAFASSETGVRGSAATESQRGIWDQQLDDMEVDPETGSSADHSSRSDFSQTPQDFKHLEPWCTSTPTPDPCQRSDYQLRQMFGIKSDVKICLQKIDEAAAGCASADLMQAESKKSEEDEKPTNCLKKEEPSLLDFYRTDEMNNKTVTEHEPSAAFHSRTTPLNSSDFNLNTKTSPALKESCCPSQKTPRRSEAEAMIGYVEPIDEDFPDENGGHPAPRLQTQTCVDANTFTRRMGRTRKRTLCPCCVPAALHPAVKSGLSFEELEAWMFITEQTGKKTARSKNPRKEGRTSVKISYRNCKIHKAPESNGLSSTPVDPDKFKKQAQITKLRDVQGEKET